MKINKWIWQYMAGGWLLLAGCVSREPVADVVLDSYPVIFPDYKDVTIPCNIAPLRFMLEEDNVEKTVVVVEGGEAPLVVEGEAEQAFDLSKSKWRALLEQSKSDSLRVKVYARQGGKWKSYLPFNWYVSTDEVDPYLVYRLIEPGYELWNRMGIYQRDLTSFRETPVLTNDLTDYNCMNCHAFNARNPERMLFHLREKHSGTYIADAKGVSKLTLPIINGKPQSLVYPSWHPSGRFVAFSLNQTKQAFHMNDRNRIEVFDLASDVVVYDLEEQRILTDSLLMRASAFETFPSFSPDGKTLYFCSADAQEMPRDFEKVRYSLCSIRFDEQSGSFGTQVDTLYNSRIENGSVSFPRLSPDGRMLAFTVSGYGNFSIWHKDADLWLLDLTTGEKHPMAAANSDDVESYHSWSSNGRWLVFSSRRLDGLYTHPYLVHIDETGKLGKPFVIPQEDPSFYKYMMYSFNIPELVQGKVEVDKRNVQKFVSE